MTTRPKRPRDPNQLAKLIVDIATGQATDETPNTNKDAVAVARGRKGGTKGGAERMRRLPQAERKALALKAARARWSKKKSRKKAQAH